MQNELPRSRAVEVSKRNLNSIAASNGVPACPAGRLNSFIPIHYTIGIRSTYKFQCTTFLKFEFHE